MNPRMGAQFDIQYVFEYFVKLLPFIQISLFIVASSIVLGLLFGLLAALPRLYRVPVLQRLSQLYVLKLVHIDITRLPVLVFVILVYGLHSGAYVSEGIRAAVSAVDRGQVEAAYAVGMNGFQAFTRIVFPQAIAIAVPILANLVIATLKDTSLAFTLGVMELTGKSQTLATMSRHFIESYIALAAVYFILSIALERLFLLAERRMLKHERDTGKTEKVPLGKKWLKKRTNAAIALSKGGTGA